MAIWNRSQLNLTPNASPLLVRQSNVGPLDSGSPCGPCSGVDGYNSSLAPDCNFIPMQQPNQIPTTTIPPANLRLTLTNENQQTIPPPTFGEMGDGRVPPSVVGGGQPQIRINPLFRKRPTVNTQSKYWYDSSTRTICPPESNIVITVPGPQPGNPKRVQRRTNPRSNGSNPCNPCGGTQGEQWNNLGTENQTLQLNGFPSAGQPQIRLGVSPGNTDQPILQTDLRRSSVTPDDRCVNTDTQSGSQGSQFVPMSRPVGSQPAMQQFNGAL